MLVHSCGFQFKFSGPLGRLKFCPWNWSFVAHVHVHTYPNLFSRGLGHHSRLTFRASFSCWSPWRCTTRCTWWERFWRPSGRASICSPTCTASSSPTSYTRCTAWPWPGKATWGTVWICTYSVPWSDAGGTWEVYPSSNLSRVYNIALAHFAFSIKSLAFQWKHNRLVSP